MKDPFPGTVLAIEPFVLFRRLPSEALAGATRIALFHTNLPYTWTHASHVLCFLHFCFHTHYLSAKGFEEKQLGPLTFSCSGCIDGGGYTTCRKWDQD